MSKINTGGDDEGMSDKKRYVKITRCGLWCIMPFGDAIDEVTMSFKEDEMGESLQWEIVEMTQGEINDLPEFGGW